MKALLPAAFKAAVFDFDGTLVDTLDLHYQAYRQVFEDRGLDLSREVFYRAIGDKANVAIPRMAQRSLDPEEIADIHVRKKARVEELFATAPISVLSPALLLPLLVGRVPLALASSGSRPGIEMLLNRSNWKVFFSVVLTGEDVTHGKPHPEIYLLAAQRIMVPPQMCLAFEDTEAGVSAAHAAGMTVIDVRRPLNLPVTIIHPQNGR